MLTSTLLYLAEASFCLAVFALTYRLLLARLTYFAWNRAYLLGALAASVLLPFLAFPGLAGFLAHSADAAAGQPLPFRLSWQMAQAAASASAPAAASLDIVEVLMFSLLGIYALGALYKLIAAVRNLRALADLARRHPQTNLGSFSIVHLPEPSLPAFSFGRHVFLSPLHDRLSDAEREQLLLHEQVHVRQRHTLDLLVVEALGVVFWFNGLLPYFGRQLKAVHEFLADEAVARTQPSPTTYGELLIKLASQQLPFALVHAFSNKQLFLRIHMLTQPSSRPMQKLRFLLVLPVFAFAWVATACAGSPTPEDVPVATSPADAFYSSPSARPIGRISWQGNTYLSTAELSQALGLKPGDAYDSLEVARRLSFGTRGGDITSRYMDHGYLFFSVSPKATRQPNGTTDLAFTINEGRKADLGTIIVSGNTKTPTTALLNMIPLRTGEPFSRANLIETQRILAQQGQFDPAKIGINPKPVMRPNQPTDLVDIELVVVEKAKP
ncbi:POTRA domain-containing protein [Hymenobacter sp. BT770]|uniref:M56 family metallopeptidase n=1 Tax=Hymenobacter sp. BT770 TaxID=2886942 RepID=UPI001D1095EA|nr:M56 family metallopeptidase [Hymenobacter sp. BT770]MCC3154637.1 hypothetical protein [Hymenobacter sp. BT770]MDO3416690.1 POTRA domain-containing protein [Hymenobacter sp. BT770]